MPRHGDLCTQRSLYTTTVHIYACSSYEGRNSKISLISNWKCVRIWKAINFMHNMVPLYRWCFSRWIIFKIWVLPNLLWLQKWFKIDIEHLKCIKYIKNSQHVEPLICFYRKISFSLVQSHPNKKPARVKFKEPL